MFLVRLIGATEHAAKHFVEHHDGGVGEGRFHFTSENNQSGQSARRIEPREMLGAQNGGFPSDCRVARAMNPLFPIRADAEIPDGLKAFDNPDKVLLGWRFRPFAHPRERCSVLVASTAINASNPAIVSCSNPSTRFLCACFRARARAARPMRSNIVAAGSKMPCPRR